MLASIHSESRATYGGPRPLAELRCRRRVVGPHRLTRMMRTAVVRRRWRRTTDSRHDLPVAANLLDRDFTAEHPDQKWVADITYVRTLEGWIHLAVLLDLFSRRVVGWSMASHIRTDLVLETLTMAVGNRMPDADLMLHSDRRSQYASFAYRDSHAEPRNRLQHESTR